MRTVKPADLAAAINGVCQAMPAARLPPQGWGTAEWHGEYPQFKKKLISRLTAASTVARSVMIGSNATLRNAHARSRAS